MSPNWHPWPPNPLDRYEGYQWVENQLPTQIESIARRLKPSLNKVPIDPKYWRVLHAQPDEETLQFWIHQTGLEEKQLEQHWRLIRDGAWQVTQEFSIARWWFLRSVFSKSPYYKEIRDQARNGSTVIDLASGFGQELRFLRHDGATGEMYAVDLKEEIWNLGQHLFKDSDENWIGFRKLDIIEDNSILDSRIGTSKVANPLQQFANKADIYLLNDFFSFFGPIKFENTLKSVMKASKIGTKITGWIFGQEGDETEGEIVYGTGFGGRGTIHTLKSFQLSWNSLKSLTNSTWNLQVQLMDFEELGFDTEDCNWFQSDFWFYQSIGRPNKIKSLCFLATRIG